MATKSLKKLDKTHYGIWNLKKLAGISYLSQYHFKIHAYLASIPSYLYSKHKYACISIINQGNKAS